MKLFRRTRTLGCSFLAVAVVVLALFALPATLPAATRTVTTLADSGPGSLRNLITASVGGDTIDFAVAGTITLTSGALVIGRDLNLIGPAGGVVVNGDNKSRVFLIIGAKVSISSFTISGGFVDYYSPGGGISATNSTLTMNNCTISRNAGGYGAGIYAATSVLTMNNCTVSGNYGSEGGGIYATTSVLTMNNCTVSGNVAFSYGGGGIENIDGRIGIQNTIIANNESVFLSPDVYGIVTSAGHNLIGIIDGSTGWLASDLTGSILAPLDPGLGPLRDNGGPTHTMALLSSSAAIDAGDDSVLGPPFNFTTDQQGRPRRRGDHVDIGAVEFSYGFTTTHLVRTLADHGGGSLREAIAAAGNFDVIVFDDAVRGKIRLTSGELSANKSLSIVGPGAMQLAISTIGNSRIFRIGPEGSVDVRGLTLSDGVVQGLNGNGPQADGAPAFGGAIYNEGSLGLFDCMITTNIAKGGDGGAGQVGQIGANTVIPGNGGLARGGAIYNVGRVLLTRCTLLGNIAAGGNGGDGGRDQSFTYFGNGGAGRVASGGAIWSSGTVMLLENCTLSDNHARGGAGGSAWLLSAPNPMPGRGGHGIGGALSGAFALLSCSILGNSAEGGFGGGPNPDLGLAGGGTGGGAGSELTVGSSTRSTIIARNSVSGHPTSNAPDVSDAQSLTPWTSLGWNLIGITDGSSGWATNDTLGNVVLPLDPLVGPCQDNGGPVWTMGLLAGSPARDKGNSTLATDARGGRRIFDYPEVSNAHAGAGAGADIGALEMDSLFGPITITKSGPVARVQFKSDTGNTYRLQQSSVVTNRTWTNVVSAPGTGQWIEGVDPATTASRRFYRVQSVPVMDVQCTPLASGLVSWWSAEGNALDRAGLNPGTLTGVTYAAGQVGQAFNFTAAGQSVTVPASASLNVGAGGGFTVEGWINPANNTTQMPIAEWSGAGGGTHLWISVSYAGFGGPGSIYASLNSDVNGISATGPGVIQPGVWQHVAMTWEAGSGVVRLYRNGVPLSSAKLSGAPPATASPLYLGARPGGPTFLGQMDELAIYSRALRPVEIQDIYAAGRAGKCAP